MSTILSCVAEIWSDFEERFAMLKSGCIQADAHVVFRRQRINVSESTCQLASESSQREVQKNSRMDTHTWVRSDKNLIMFLEPSGSSLLLKMQACSRSRGWRQRELMETGNLTR